MLSSIVCAGGLRLSLTTKAEARRQYLVLASNVVVAGHGRNATFSFYQQTPATSGIPHSPTNTIESISRDFKPLAWARLPNNLLCNTTKLPTYYG